jgi:Ankyrin repeats (3 copies)
MRLQDFLNLSPTERHDLQKLDLSHNALSTLNAESWKAVGEALAQCHNLQTLSLGNNELGLLNAESWKAVGEALAQCHNLQTLDLGNSDLGLYSEPESWKAIGEALAQCHKLQTLNLSGNYLGSFPLSESWKGLGEALAQCHNLQTLNLGNNNLRTLNADFWKMLETVFHNLQTLDLRDNALLGLDDAQSEALYETLSTSETLTQIEGITEFKKEYQEKLNAMLNRNRRYLENIEKTLAESFPKSTEIPSDLQAVIMHYILPPQALPKKDKSKAPQKEQESKTDKDTKALQEQENIQKVFDILEKGPYDSEEAFKVLLNTVGVNIQLSNGYTLLHAACENLDVPENWIKILLDQGANPNIIMHSEDHSTLLSCVDLAVIHNREDIINLLVKQPNVTTETWERALKLCSALEQPEMHDAIMQASLRPPLTVHLPPAKTVILSSHSSQNTQTNPESKQIIIDALQTMQEDILAGNKERTESITLITDMSKNLQQFNAEDIKDILKRLTTMKKALAQASSDKPQEYGSALKQIEAWEQNFSENRNAQPTARPKK